jgi:catecholate siderophore receptor
LDRFNFIEWPISVNGIEFYSIPEIEDNAMMYSICVKVTWGVDECCKRRRAPRSLRSPIAFVVPNDDSEIDVSLKIAMACFVVAGSISGPEAQESPLLPVTIDAPVTRPRTRAAKPTPEQIPVRNELRRLARERQQQQQAAPKPAATPAVNLPPDRNPYADPSAPYRA